MAVSLSSLANSLQFLSNLADITVASGVESVHVEVRCDGALIFDELLYADREGEVVLYDVRQMVMPSANVPVSNVHFTVGEEQEALTYSFDVVYCTSRILPTSASASDNNKMLACNWLTSASTRSVSMDQSVRLARYVSNRVSVGVRCDATVVYRGKLIVLENVPAESVDESPICYYDASPETVHGYAVEKLEELGYEHPELCRLMSYAFQMVPTNGSAAPSVCRFDVVKPGASDVCVRFRNMWGFEDGVLLRGSAAVEHSINIETAYIGGKMCRVDDRHERSYAFTVPLATDEDLAILEQIAGSDTIQVYDASLRLWRECVVTGAEPSEATMGSAENSYVITYRPIENDHRVTSLYSGSPLRQGVFDDKHTDQFD